MNKEMNIFKKIWYSIGKPKKYEEMTQEGFKKALSYITILIILFSFVISGITVFKIHQSYETQIDYIEKNLPELSYSEGVLKFDSEKEIILSDETVKDIIGGTVIINTNNIDEEQVELYNEKITSDGDYGVILLSENMILIANNTGEVKVQEYTYKELFEENFGEDLEFNKEDVISYFDNISYLSYFMTYTVTYFVSMFIIMAVNILVMSLIGLLYVKLMKINMKYKNILSISIYASTIAILLNIIYYILLGIFNIAIPYFDAIYISIPYIYLLLVLQGKRVPEK